MVDSTLDWQEAHGAILDELDPATRLRVLDSIQTNVIEGFDPDATDVQRAVDHALGRLSIDELIAGFTEAP